MAVAGPDRVGISDLSPTTITHFRGEKQEERLAASEELFRKALLGRNNQGILERADHVLEQLGYSKDQRPLLAKILGLVNSGHAGSTETGWRYRDSMDKRQVRGFVDLDSPLPKVAGIVANIGREPSAEETNSFSSILDQSKSSEIARIYIFDSTFWNSSELVKILTARSKKPPFGIHSVDKKLAAAALYIPRMAGLVGTYSSRMEGRHDMVVDSDIPGEAKAHNQLRFVTQIEGVGFLAGTSVDNLRTA